MRRDSVYVREAMFVRFLLGDPEPSYFFYRLRGQTPSFATIVLVAKISWQEQARDTELQTAFKACLEIGRDD